MTKALLDTTILADFLLKSSAEKKKAAIALARYEVVLLPMYAVKEFKRGPLRGYVWLHNKVVTGSWSEAILSINSVFRQRNLQATALRAVADFSSSMKIDLRNFSDSPRILDHNELMRKHARIWLKTKIMQAWRGLFRKPFQLYAQLPCYSITAPREEVNGLIDLKPRNCTLQSCCLKDQLLKQSAAAEKLEKVCRISDKPEMAKRAKVLRSIRRHPRNELTDSQCVTLGDIVFALQCPEDAVVLTTNVADHRPLASAIAKRVEQP